ncbi:hypothetical protein, conserved, partial [Babesia bigemina]
MTSDIESKLVSLGHLAGQLGGFVGQSESVKQAVVKAIDILTERQNKCKNSKNVSHNLDCQDPSNCHDITQQIEKLESLKNASESNKNNPNELLNNLCDGLETFLGFNSTSKGYDGQGIVYSDLDRLCDAVMGFLSGVLSNIKDHLGQHKDTLDVAIDTLNKNKHAGKKGFNEAIGSVVAGVGRYNGNVKTSNDLVKTAIKKLQRDMKNYKKEELQTNLPNNIDPKRPTASTQESVEKAMSLVEQCQKFAKEFIRAVDIKTKTDATKNAIKDLNPKLRDTIENVRKNMQHESKRLKELSSKESKDLEATEDKIKKTLSSLKVNVDCRIDAQMKELIKKLSERVQKILDKLKGIEKKLLGYVKELYTWLEDARKLINEADKEVDIILKQVNEPAVGETNDKKKIEEKVQTISDGLDTRIVELTKWNAAGTEAVKLAKEKCTQIGGMVETTNNVDKTKIYGLASDMKDKADKLREAAKQLKNQIGTWVQRALAQVKSMDAALKGDLYKVKDAVSRQVTGIKNKIGELYETVFGRTGAGKNNQGIENVLKHVKGQVGSIRGNTGETGRLSGLQGVTKKVSDYVNKFTDSNIENTVHGWMESSVLNVLGAVDGSLTKYVTYNQTYGYYKIKQQKEAQDKVKKIIFDHIKPKLTQDIKQCASHVKKNVTDLKENLTNVASCLDELAKKLENKIKIGDIKGDEIIRKIEHDTELVYEDKQTYHYKTDLYNAVDGILHQLVGMAKQVANELKTLLLSNPSPNIASMVQGSLNTANDFYEKLEKVLKLGTHAAGTNYAAAVDAAINKVTETLDTEIGSSDRSKSTVTLTEESKKFEGYKRHVSQPMKSEQLTGTTEEGSLPAAIGEIKTNVTTKLNNGTLGTEIDSDETFKSPFESITTKLKEIAGLVDSDKPTPKSSDSKTGITNYLDDMGRCLARILLT